MIFNQTEAIQNVLNVIVRKSGSSDAYVLARDVGKENRNTLFRSLSREDTICDECWNIVAANTDHNVELEIENLVPSTIKSKLETNGTKSMMLTPIWKENSRCDIIAILIICNSNANHRWTIADKEVATLGAEIISAAMRLGYAARSKMHISELVIYPDKTADSIAEAFNKIRKSPKKGLDLWEEKGRTRFKSLVSYYIKQGLPIPFVMPAFPFKSRNTETKVTGPLPDKGEELALQTLANFSEDVKKVYPPGAEMLVISDGHVFSDIYEIDDDVTTEYRNKLLTLCNNSSLQYMGFNDFFHPDQSYTILREKLMILMGETLEVVNARIKEDPAQNAIFCGMKRFMEEEFNHANAAFGQKTQLVKRIKVKCRNMMLRNEAYSNLIQVFFPNHIRLSIHPHSNVFKFGVNLIGNTLCGSPWHNVAVFYPSTGTWAAMKLQDAISHGSIRTADENSLEYFVAVEVAIEVLKGIDQSSRAKRFSHGG